MVKKLLNGVIDNVIAVDIDVEKLDLCRVKQPQHRVAVSNCLLDGSLHLDKVCSKAIKQRPENCVACLTYYVDQKFAQQRFKNRIQTVSCRVTNNSSFEVRIMDRKLLILCHMNTKGEL